MLSLGNFPSFRMESVYLQPSKINKIENLQKLYTGETKVLIVKLEQNLVGGLKIGHKIGQNDS